LAGARLIGLGTPAATEGAPNLDHCKPRRDRRPQITALLALDNFGV